MACISDEDKRLFSRLEDLLYLSEKRCSPCFLGFLDLREQALLRQKLRSVNQQQWHFFGGYEDAERAFLAVYPDYYDSSGMEYPFTAVAFRYRRSQSLTHRDFLGTLLAAGVKRDTIGDILCGDGLSVAFISTEITPFVCDQIQRVGGEGVTLTPDYTGDLPISRSYQDIHDTVASARLDAVVKALIHTSREDAAQMIRTGLVSVDHLPTDSVAHFLSAPCTISIRGYGRYLIDQLGPETKKGRLQLFARKCI